MIRTTSRSPAFLSLAAAGLIVPTLLSAGEAPRPSLELESIQVESLAPRPRGPIQLEFLGPRQTTIPTLTTDGFPLTLRLTSINEIGIGIGAAETLFPVYEETRGFIVFDDPDGCHSWAPADECDVVDETYVEFNPGDSLPDVPDFLGEPFVMVALSTIGGGGSPQLLGFNSTTGVNDMLYPYGPDLGGPDQATTQCLSRLGNHGPCLTDADCFGGSTCQAFPVEPDGYGLGADDDLPGLVLLSDTGVGLILDQNADPVVPRQARNLAGLISSIGYNLNDPSRRTSIVAHLTAPPGAFNPVVLFDDCVAPPSDPACSCGTPGPTACPIGPRRVRVDGGAPQDVENEGELRSLLGSRLITVRAFVVNQTAPFILTDMDGDDLVTAKDADLAGLQLLSGEVAIQFRQLHEKPILAADNAIRFDFDGNGLFPLVLPVHGGTLTQVPR